MGITVGGGLKASPNQVSTPVVLKPKVLLPAKKNMTLTSLGGDILRGVTSSFTDGHFGNGNAAQRQGESNAEYYARLAQAGGAAAETFNNTVTKSSNTTNMADAATNGITQQAVSNAIKTYLPMIAVVGVGIWAAKKFIFKGGRRPKY